MPKWPWTNIKQAEWRGISGDTISLDLYDAMTLFDYSMERERREGFWIGLGMAALLAAGLWLLVIGCAVPEPGMADGKLQMAKREAAPRSAVAPDRTVTLRWDPWKAGEWSNQVHLVVAESRDLRGWAVITNLPCCATSVVLAATERCGFYRVGWNWGFYRPGCNWE